MMEYWYNYKSNEIFGRTWDSYSLEELKYISNEPEIDNAWIRINLSTIILYRYEPVTVNTKRIVAYEEFTITPEQHQEYLTYQIYQAL